MAQDRVVRQLTAQPNNEGVDAAVRAARRLVAALVLAGDETAAEMNDVAERLNEVAEHLEGHAPDAGKRMVDMWAGEGVPRHDPVTGPENTIAPPVLLSGCDDGSVEGTVTLGLAYQGPPGCVHGGVSALILDHTLGVANAWAGESGMTGSLTMRYRRPVPLFEELIVRGRQLRVDGRKIYAEGTINLDDEVLVSAEGLFVNTFDRPLR